MNSNSDADTSHWLGPLLAVLVAQIAVTFLARMSSTLAPSLSNRMLWSVSDIGFLASFMAIGSALFMLVGLPLVLRAGPVRSLQAGLLVGAVGAMLFALPVAAGPLVGSLLFGVAAGPQPSAGSSLLRQYAPAGRLNLIFSIKQAGVPMGGVLAGLLMPLMLQALGLVTTFFACAALAIAASLAIQPLRRRLDQERDRTQPTHLRLLLSLENLRRPLRAMTAQADLRRIAIVGACLALGQGVWFVYLVSHLVVQLGLSLSAAGGMFALMLAVSVVGRPFLGWLADRMNPNTILKGVTVISAIMTAALAFLTPVWPQWAVLLLVVAAGGSVSSWNGVQIARMTHFALPGAVAESITGATLLIYVSSVAGPALFAGIVALGGDFRFGFVVAAGLTLVALVPLSKLPGGAPR